MRLSPLVHRAGWWLVVLLAGVVGAHAEEAPVLKDKDVLKPAFYIAGGPSAIFVNPPKRDDHPLYILDAGGNAVGGVEQKPVSFSGDDVSVTGRMAFGYQFGEKTPDLLGRNLQVEASGNLWGYRKEETDVLDTGGYTLGYFGERSDGSLIGQAIGSPGDPVNLHFSGDYDYYDVNLGMRSEYALVKDRLDLVPYVGGMYARFDQGYKTLAARSSDPTDLARYKEDMHSSYWGATFGLDFRVRIIKGLTFSLGGTISPMWADDELRYRGVSEGSVTGVTGATDNGSTFSFRATGTGRVAYTVDWFTVALEGGVDHWNHAANIKYPTVPAGESALAFPSFAPSLRGDHMTNWRVGLGFTFRFP
jgi:hypothetical protein